MMILLALKKMQKMKNMEEMKNVKTWDLKQSQEVEIMKEICLRRDSN
jgi:hypothetical protein